MGSSLPSPTASCKCLDVSNDTDGQHSMQDEEHRIVDSDVLQAEVLQKQERSAKLVSPTSALPTQNGTPLQEPSNETKADHHSPHTITPHTTTNDASVDGFLREVMDGTGWTNANGDPDKCEPDIDPATDSCAQALTSCVEHPSVSAPGGGAAILDKTMSIKTRQDQHNFPNSVSRNEEKAGEHLKHQLDLACTSGNKAQPRKGRSQKPVERNINKPAEKIDTTCAEGLAVTHQQDGDAGESKSPFGKIFVQREGRGVASYHFISQDEAYISYKKAKQSWILDNGEPFPKKKHFKDLQFDIGTRTLHATIDWSPATKQGHQRWVFEMVFNVPFSRIAGGSVKMYHPSATQFDKMARFGTDMEYRILKGREHQESLEAMEKARQFLA